MPERLIDRAKLLEYLAAIKPDEYVSAYGEAAVDVINHVETYVNEMPIIDAEPVRHGRWIKSDVYTFKKCSECGAIWDAALCENIFFIYCPRCGSKNGGADNG